MHACKSNFPQHGVPCFQHIHHCPTRLILPEGMLQPIFHVWKNPVWSALLPAPCTPDHAGHVNLATRTGLSAAPVPLHGLTLLQWSQRGTANALAEQHYPGADPCYLQANNTDPQTPSRKGIPVWHCLFPQSPSKAAPQDCPALLLLWAAPDKTCQNLPKHALSHRRHQLKAVWDASKFLRKKKKAFSCPNINSCFTLSYTKIWFESSHPYFGALTQLSLALPHFAICL